MKTASRFILTPDFSNGITASDESGTWLFCEISSASVWHRFTDVSVQCDGPQQPQRADTQAHSRTCRWILVYGGDEYRGVFLVAVSRTPLKMGGLVFDIDKLLQASQATPGTTDVTGVSFDGGSYPSTAAAATGSIDCSATPCRDPPTRAEARVAADTKTITMNRFLAAIALRIGRQTNWARRRVR